MKFLNTNWNVYFSLWSETIKTFINKKKSSLVCLKFDKVTKNVFVCCRIKAHSLLFSWNCIHIYRRDRFVSIIAVKCYIIHSFGRGRGVRGIVLVPVVLWNFGTHFLHTQEPSLQNKNMSFWSKFLVDSLKV